MASGTTSAKRISAAHTKHRINVPTTAAGQTNIRLRLGSAVKSPTRGSDTVSDGAVGCGRMSRPHVGARPRSDRAARPWRERVRPRRWWRSTWACLTDDCEALKDEWPPCRPFGITVRTRGNTIPDGTVSRAVQESQEPSRCKGGRSEGSGRDADHREPSPPDRRPCRDAETKRSTATERTCLFFLKIRMMVSVASSSCSTANAEETSGGPKD